MTTVDEILAHKAYPSLRERALERAEQLQALHKAELNEEAEEIIEEVYDWLAAGILTPDELSAVGFEKGEYNPKRALVTWKVDGLEFRAHYVSRSGGKIELEIEFKPKTAWHTIENFDDLAQKLTK